MSEIWIYVDGSFGDAKTGTHGGVVWWNEKTNKPESYLHVESYRNDFVSMRNVGGEVIAAWSAIMTTAGRIMKNNEEYMDTYDVHLVYDYKGIGAWLTGEWQCKKTATKWFKSTVDSILQKVPNMHMHYHWIKGHTGNRGNTEADSVASYDKQFVLKNNIDCIVVDNIIA